MQKTLSNNIHSDPDEIVKTPLGTRPSSMEVAGPLSYKKGSTTPFLIGLPLPSTVLPSAL